MKKIALLLLNAGLGLALQAQTPTDSIDFWKAEYQNFKSNNRQKETLLAVQHWARLDTVSVQACVELAQTYHAKGQVAEAEIAYLQALERDTTSAPLKYQTARFYQSIGEDKKAHEMYKSLLQTDSTNAFYYRRGAILSASLRELWKAFKWHQKSIELEPDEPENYLAFAETYMDMRAYAHVDSLINQALELNPENWRGIMLSAKSAYVQSDYEDVVRLLEPHFPQSIGNAISARFYGISLYQIGRYEDAIAVLTFLAELDPELEYTYYYMGLCHQKMGDLDTAAEHFKKAIEQVSVSNLSAYHEALGLLQQQEEQHAEAIQHLRMAQSLRSDVELLYHLAVSYDAYYADKGTAQRAFEKYAITADTAENPRFRYAVERLEEMKREEHFSAEPEE